MYKIDVKFVYGLCAAPTQRNCLIRGLIASGSDANYVDACIPIVNSNLDCKDILYCNFYAAGKW